MFKVLALVAATAAVASAVRTPVRPMADLDMQRPALRAELVDEVNTAGASWTASMRQGAFLEGASVAQAKGLMGTLLEGGPDVPKKQWSDAELRAFANIPANFSSAQHWPQCAYQISKIRDQSACGSCWAFGAAEAMSDRFCIHEQLNVSVAAADLMSCCFTCGNGCQGGYPGAAWGWWNVMGLVDNTCDPYPFPSCSHHVNGPEPPCPSRIYQTPPCHKQCSASSGENWSSDKKYGATHYAVDTGVQAIQVEIMTNGPVETAFTVYEDFLTYKSGVYEHTTGNILGGHAVKFVGWGVTAAGEEYWIVNNSWNDSWGLHGTFWIKRGVNECGIESTVWGGLPKAQ
jgi:cathepsin B